MTQQVSIHAPWEGCDRNAFPAMRGLEQFQFTHPGKGATKAQHTDSRALRVSIHAPWEGCDTLVREVNPGEKVVSIHAPWEGCDILCTLGSIYRETFQFTHPGKGATSGSILSADRVAVSIHAPWEGCDYLVRGRRGGGRSFNSRTLGRVRLRQAIDEAHEARFNSRTLGRVRRAHRPS